MKKYHVVWVIQESPHLTTGKNIIASSMTSAILKFEQEYGFEPWYIVEKPI